MHECPCKQEKQQYKLIGRDRYQCEQAPPSGLILGSGSSRTRTRTPLAALGLNVCPSGETFAKAEMAIKRRAKPLVRLPDNHVR